MTRLLARHRGGYCYHLNGAFSLLLESLGFDVVWHRAGVQNRSEPDPVGPDSARHLTLTVHRAPSLLRASRADTTDFAARHGFLSTAAESPFVRTCSVYRRDARGVDALVGCVLRRIGDGAATETLESPNDWFAALSDVFGLPLIDVGPEERRTLWANVYAAHEAWVASEPERRATSTGVGP